jgi:hypothetical protein
MGVRVRRGSCRGSIITHPLANERLKRNRAGRVVLQPKSPYKDGTSHVVMEPLECIERLAALCRARVSI